MSFFFGGAPELKVKQRDVVTPEQKSLFNNDLLSLLRGQVGQGGFGGQFAAPARQTQLDAERELFGVPQSTAEDSLSLLTGVGAARANAPQDLGPLGFIGDTFSNLIGGAIDRNFGGDLGPALGAYLGRFTQPNEQRVDELFNSLVRDPLTTDFIEDILPSIDRQFFGNNFFTSNRGDLVSEGVEDLADSLAQGRGELANQELGRNFSASQMLEELAAGERRRGTDLTQGREERALRASQSDQETARFLEDLRFRGQESRQDRQLRAGESLGSLAGQQANLFSQALQGSEQIRQIDETAIDRQIADLERQLGIDNQTAALMLQAIGTPMFENIAVGLQGQEGAAGGLLQGLMQMAGPALAAALSSKDFKEEVEHDYNTLDKISSLDVPAWKYKEEIEPGQPTHVGPYAEDFQEAFGLGSGKTIPYVDMFGVALRGVKELNAKVDSMSKEMSAALDALAA